MQTFQTRQILAIIKAKFSRENSILTSRCMKKQNGSLVRWSFLLLCRINFKLRESEASSLI